MTKKSLDRALTWWDQLCWRRRAPAVACSAPAASRAVNTHVNTCSHRPDEVLFSPQMACTCAQVVDNCIVQYARIQWHRTWHVVLPYLQIWWHGRKSTESQTALAITATGIRHAHYTRTQHMQICPIQKSIKQTGVHIFSRFSAWQACMAQKL